LRRETHRKKEGDLVARATRLLDLLQYQEEAVVSRTLIDKKGGTVTLFAFDEAQGLSEHTAPYDAMVYVLEGETEVTIEGKPITLRAGEMAIMPANKSHALKALTRFKMLLMMVRE